MRTGVIAKKIGMSRIFKDDGSNIPVTVLQMDNCTVIQKKVENLDGYNAVSVSYGKKEKNANKPTIGFYKKNKMTISKILREFRVSDNGFLDTGTKITCQHFVIGQKVDVTGFTIGKGFAGGMKRHNFAGNRATHGVSISHRSHGSTGQCQDPGKVFKGKKMAGRLGNVKRTIQNLEVVKTIIEDDLILVKGSVPGPRGLYVTISDAVKIKQDLPYPTSNNLVQEQEKNPGEDSNQNLNTDENTENIENKNNEISQKMNEDMKATSNENAKSVDQDNKTEKQGESK